MKTIILLAVVCLTVSVFSNGLQPGSTPRLTGDNLALGDAARILLHTYYHDGELTIGLCDNKNCSIIRITGIVSSTFYHPEPYCARPNYYFGFTKTTDILPLERELEILRNETHYGEKWVENLDIIFVVQRLSPFVMGVCMEENPSFVITIPVRTTHVSLKVHSTAGQWSFIEEGIHIGFRSVIGSAPTGVSATRLNGDPLALNQVVGVEVQRIHQTAFTSNNFLYIGMCGRLCSIVVVMGTNATSPYGYPSFRYSSGYTCKGDESKSCGGVNIEREEGSGEFTWNERRTFLVQRLGRDALAVWLEDRPDFVVTVPLARDRVKLRVHTIHLGPWTFSGNKNNKPLTTPLPPAATTVSSLRFSTDSTGIHRPQPDSTPRLNGDNLAVGDAARILLHTFYPEGNLTIGLCGAQNCSIIRITGIGNFVTALPFRVRPSHFFGFTNTTDILTAEEEVEILGRNREDGSKWVENLDIVFVVQRLSPFVMGVWMEENPTFITAIPIRATHFSLNVQSTAGEWSFIGEGTHIGLGSILGSTPTGVTDPRLNGDPLGPKEIVGVEVQRIHRLAKNYHMYIGMCGRICSLVEVKGVNATSPYGHPSFRYTSGYSFKGDECSYYSTEIEKGTGTFEVGKRYMFLVQRLGPDALAVWLESRPDFVVAIPLAIDRVKLRVQTIRIGPWKFAGDNNTKPIFNC